MHIFILTMALGSVDILVWQIILYSLIIYLNCPHVKYCKKYALPWIYVSLISVNFPNLSRLLLLIGWMHPVFSVSFDKRFFISKNSAGILWWQVQINVCQQIVRSTTSTSNSRKPYTKHQKRTFWLYTGIGLLKLGRMHRQTGETFADPTTISRQMREVSGF